MATFCSYVIDELHTYITETNEYFVSILCKFLSYNLILSIQFTNQILDKLSRVLFCACF